MLQEIFFGTGAALKLIFELGIEFKDEHFYKFTKEHYDKLRIQGEEISETMYMLIPDSYMGQHLEEVQIVTESEKNSIIKAVKTIENYCNDSGLEFNTYEAKLKYVASVMPEVFSDGTKFDKYKNIKRVK